MVVGLEPFYLEPVIHLGFVGLTSKIPTIRIYMHGPNAAGLRQAYNACNIPILT